MSVERRTAPASVSRLSVAAAIALAMAAPLAGLQAIVNSGGDAPRWARNWNGFRMADEARGRLSGDPENPQAGLTLGAGAAELARAAYAREPLATDALLVIALAESGTANEYHATPTATLGAKIDKRNALLELLLIADAARREDYNAMSHHADILAAAHPGLARTVLAPLFDQLGDPAVLPIVSDALNNKARWAAAFESYVPRDEAALRNYLTLRRQAPAGTRWESDEKLVAALADRGLYDEAFAMWRFAADAPGNRYGFMTDEHFAPIGWQLVVRGDRTAQVDGEGALSVSVERGAGGELARQLLDLPAGRYRLETTIEASDTEAPLWISLTCAAGGGEQRKPLKAKMEFVVGGSDCQAHWLVLGASALESRHGVEARLSDWRFSQVR